VQGRAIISDMSWTRVPVTSPSDVDEELLGWLKMLMGLAQDDAYTDCGQARDTSHALHLSHT
jgi:hypothetical protein